MDCLLNLGVVAGSFLVDGVMMGGLMNPFDAFDDVLWVGFCAAHFGIEVINRGGFSMVRTKSFDFGPNRKLVVIMLVFRFFLTFWVYDEVTGMLFTSDMFSHTDSRPGGDDRTIDRCADEVDGGVASMAWHFFCKFWWLVGARTERLEVDVDGIMDEFQFIIIVLMHGWILRGADVVTWHREMLLVIIGGVVFFVVDGKGLSE